MLYSWYVVNNGKGFSSVKMELQILSDDGGDTLGLVLRGLLLLGQHHRGG